PTLAKYTAEAARRVLQLGLAWQAKFQSEFARTLVYFSDEFYVEAELDFPEAAYYDDFPQLENGIGLSRLFLDEIDALLPVLPHQIAARRVHIATGVSAAKTMQSVIDKVCGQVNGLEVSLHVVRNRFFGPDVTVAGLLTGKDLVEGIADLEGGILLLPQVMFKTDEQLFLDNLTPKQVACELNAEIIVVQVNGLDFLTELVGQDLASVE
ncbi:MAG: DUF512 domain-containing protein, partial [Peptococcaceae bacterium]|nr:DUF512 domain-containing protein [Peptococcaceae bacterium]